MKLSGWIFIIISWTFIISLVTFCFSRIFKKGLGGKDPKDGKTIDMEKWDAIKRRRGG